jgi:hypothetical protein
MEHEVFAAQRAGCLLARKARAIVSGCEIDEKIELFLELEVKDSTATTAKEDLDHSFKAPRRAHQLTFFRTTSGSKTRGS